MVGRGHRARRNPHHPVGRDHRARRNQRTSRNRPYPSSGVRSTKPSSANTRASSGAWIRRTCPRRSSSACPCARATTSTTTPTTVRAFPSLATTPSSTASSTTRTSRLNATSIGLNGARRTSWTFPCSTPAPSTRSSTTSSVRSPGVRFASRRNAWRLRTGRGRAW